MIKTSTGNWNVNFQIPSSSSFMDLKNKKVEDLISRFFFAVFLLFGEFFSLSCSMKIRTVITTCALYLYFFVLKKIIRDFYFLRIGRNS